MTVLAANVEVWLIRYAGQLVDKLASNAPLDFWANEWPGRLLAALAVLLFRPFAQILHLAVNDIALVCNAANLVR